MRKGTNLQATVHLGTAPGAADDFKAALPSAFEKVNPGTTLAVRKLSPVDEQGNAKLRIYVEGDQDPAADFSAFVLSALQKTLATMPGVTMPHVGETEDEDDESEVILSPKARAAADAVVAQNQRATGAGAVPPPASAEASTPPATGTASQPGTAAPPAVGAPEADTGTPGAEPAEPFWKRLFGRG